MPDCTVRSGGDGERESRGAGLTVTTSVNAHLTWNYSPGAPRMRALYEFAKQAQWNATTDIDWSLDVPFGEPLQDYSSYVIASFENSPLMAHGRPMWDRFRWEFQAWMVSQFMHGEQGALLASARLVESLPDVESKYYASSQVVDEARHVEVFARYLRERVPSPYGISAPLLSLLADVLNASQWDMTALGMQVMIEPLAMASFRLAENTFHDDLIKQIAAHVARDEARHVSFGIQLLNGICPHMTGAELSMREEFILEAAHLLSQRFLLEDIWDRLGIDRREGMTFAATSPMMVGYRQTIFAKIVASLVRIGLMTDRVHDGFARMNLLGYAGTRAAATEGWPAARAADQRGSARSAK
jgi:hypothetical protein